MLTAARYHATPLPAAVILASVSIRPAPNLSYRIPGGPPSEAIRAEKLSPAAVGYELSPSFCASVEVPIPEPHPISIPLDQPGIRYATGWPAWTTWPTETAGRTPSA